MQPSLLNKVRALCHVHYYTKYWPSTMGICVSQAPVPDPALNLYLPPSICIFRPLSLICIYQSQPSICFCQPRYSICIFLLFVLQLNFVIVTVSTYINSTSTYNRQNRYISNDEINQINSPGIYQKVCLLREEFLQ